MRYRISIILLISLVAQSASAQNAYDPGRFHLGVKGGFNATAIFQQQNYGQTLMDYVVPVHAVGGLVAQYRFDRMSYLVIEAAYQGLGQTHEDFFKRKEFYKNIKLNYIVVPVMYKLVLNEPKSQYNAAAKFTNPKFYLIGGLQPGFLASAEIRYEINDLQTDFITFITEGGNPNLEEIQNMDPPEEDEDLYNGFDLSVVGGLGMFVRFQREWSLFVEIRGGLSLTDINAEEWRLPSSSGSYRASRNMFIGLQVGLAYKIF